MKSKIVAIVLSLGLVIRLATSCGDDKDDKNVLTGINITSTEGDIPLLLTVGGEQEIIANTVPDDVPNVVFKWTSEDSNIATVSDHGREATVRGKKAGTTNIVVASGNVTQKVAVTVTEPKKKELHLLGVAFKDAQYNIRYYIGNKVVNWKSPLVFVAKYAYPEYLTMNIVGNDTIIHVLAYSGYADTTEYMVFKNDAPYSIVDNSAKAMVHSVYVSGSDVYAIGQYQNGAKKVACYWKNNVRTDLPSDKDACAYNMTISNGNIYVTGSYVTGTYTWESIKELPIGAPDDFNILGIYNESVPCYWKDGIRKDLTFSMPTIRNTHYQGEAHSIVVDAEKVYIMGRVWTTVLKNGSAEDGFEVSRSGSANLCYWKNDSFTSLVNANAFGFAVHNGDLYFPGAYYTDVENHITQACYFKNSEKVDLTSDKAVIELATSLIFEGDVMYVAGASMSATTNSALWKDNVQTLLDSDFLPLGQIFIK
jgi:hypothetical protein